jgi:predicted amidophosphoribosyltransferase
MICSGCGKEIPLDQTVCPTCAKDTNSDQQAQLLSFICFGVLLAGGLFFGHAAWGAAAGIAAAFAVQIVHRRLQGWRDGPR